jgi:hypothetical protein
MKRIMVMLLTTLFFSNWLYGTVYEDGNGAINWRVSDNKPSGATIHTVLDDNRSVIEFKGRGVKNAYLLGDKRDSNNAWNNTQNRYITWSMKFDSSFRISLFIKTKKGSRVIYYDNKSGKGERRKKIHYGLGGDSTNGRWQTITRDIEADIQAFETNNKLVTVYGFMVRGNGKIHYISMDDENSTNLEVIADTTKPIITLLGGINLTIIQNTTYIDAGAIATDNIDGDISSNIITVNPVNTTTIGTYTITYDVNDSNGNQAVQVTRVVNVTAPPTPSVILNSISISESSISLRLCKNLIFRNSNP